MWWSACSIHQVLNQVAPSSLRCSQAVNADHPGELAQEFRLFNAAAVDGDVGG